MTAPTSSSGPSSGRPMPWVPLVVGLLGIVVVVGGILLARGEGDDGTASAPGEIFLEAAADAGPNPFTPPVDPPAPAEAAAIVNATPQSGVAPSAGAPLYGGTGDDRVCDREAMIRFLTANPALGRAWAAVAGIAYEDLATYIRGLTPTVLLYDTRVTNHGFSGGRATPRQSVLQAGTAVLVDASGQPVAKCKCGNPLRPPVRAVADPTYVGTPWPGYQPGVYVTVVINVPGDSETTTTTDRGVTVTDADLAIQILTEQLSLCGKSAEIDGVTEDADFPGVFIVDATVEGASAQFVVDIASETVGEGDRTSAGIVEECGFA